MDRYRKSVFSNFQMWIAFRTYKICHQSWAYRQCTRFNVYRTSMLATFCSHTSLLFRSRRPVSMRNPLRPRRFIIHHDGIHVLQGVIWTKYNPFVAVVQKRCSLIHFLLETSQFIRVECAHTAEFFLLSVFHLGVSHIVRVLLCKCARRTARNARLLQYSTSGAVFLRDYSSGERIEHPTSKWI